MNVAGVVLSLALTFAAGSSMAAQPRAITHTQLDTMFADMKARAPWNLDGDLLWGYFFTSPYRNQLEQAGDQLTAQGYRFVEIRQVGPERWLLHVEKIEHHTADSLFLRNEQLYQFADSYLQVIYDGMDVGPTE